jgi:hypothetical protein
MYLGSYCGDDVQKYSEADIGPDLSVSSSILYGLTVNIPSAISQGVKPFEVLECRSREWVVGLFD